MRKQVGFSRLRQDVIDVGCCAGCGSCVGVCAPQAITMGEVEGEPEPVLVGKCSNCGMCLEVCPGREVPLADLDSYLFGRKRHFVNEPLGIYRQCLRGQAQTVWVQQASASGGMVPALLIYALDQKIIDAALLAGWDKDRPWRCAPMLAESPEEVLRAARTALVMVPVNCLIYQAAAAGKHKSLAVVGLPCHVHAIRKLQLKYPKSKLARSIKLVLGLFCAGACYYAGLEHLLIEVGGIRNLGEIECLDWRAGEWPGAMMASTRDGKLRYVASKHDYAWHFLQSATYKRERCLVCADWSSELADLSFGDIFQTLGGSQRWSATLVRSEMGELLVEMASKAGAIKVEPHDASLLPASGLGFESKKHACVYRIMQRRKRGLVVPDFQYELGLVPFPRQLSFPK